MTVSADALPAEQAGGSDITRREFLNYAWLATIGVLTAELTVVTYLFAFPRLGPGEFGGPVAVGGLDGLEPPGADPFPYNKAKFWWVQNVAASDGRIKAQALYKVCTHLGCIYGWKPDQNKFICPCHGSQFSREGFYRFGPAPRGLDRFVIRAVDGSGAEVASSDPETGILDVTDLSGVNLIVETGMRLKGPEIEADESELRPA